MAGTLLLGTTSAFAGPPPSTPSGLTTTAVSAASVSASWKAAGSDTSYTLQASPNSGFTSPVYSSSTANTFATISGLAANTTYYMEVDGCNSRGCSGYSASISSPTMADPPQQLPTTFLGINLSSIAVNWAALPTSPLSSTSEGYELDASSTNFGALAPGGLVYSSVTFSDSQSTLTISGLDPNTTYYFQVGSLNWAGVPDYTALGSTATLAPPPQTLPETFLQTDTSSITVNWAALPSSPLSSSSEGYELDASSTNFGALSPGGILFSSITFDGSQSTLTISGLDPNTTYYFRVASLNWDDETDYTFLGATPTLANAPQTAATTFLAIYLSSISVDWTALPPSPSSGASEGYELDASSTNFGAISPGGIVYSSITFSNAQSALTVPGLDPNTTYYFRVGSLNWAGVPDYAALGSTPTLANAPSALPAAFLQINASSVTANWAALPAAPSSSSCEGYELDASSTNFTGGLIYSSATFSDSQSTLTVSGLDPNTTYYFRVASINSSDETNYSTLGSTSTLAPPPPSGPLSWSIYLASVTVGWPAMPATPSSSTSEGYELQASSTNFGDFQPGGIVYASATTSDSQNSLTVQNLDPNTLYYFRVGSFNWNAALNFAVLGASSTLAQAPTTLSTAFLDVYFTSATVAWAALPPAPPSSTTCEGYELDASTTDFGALSPGGVVSSSATSSVAQSTLTVLSPPLQSGSIYYFRAGSLNWSGIPNFTLLGSTLTLLETFAPAAGTPPFTSVSSASLTANWTANGNPAETIYTVLSSTDSGFAGSPASTTTFSLSVSSLSLLSDTTYYFEVKATSGASSSAYTQLGGTCTLTDVPGAASSSWAAVWVTSASVFWLPNTNPLDVTTYSVVMTTGPAYPNGDHGNVVLSTTPAGAVEEGMLTGLVPNTTYFLFTAGVNYDDMPSAYAGLGSTSSLAAPPLTAVSTFSAVTTNSFSASWDADGNPVNVTSYTVEVSTDPNFRSGMISPYDVSFDTAPGGSEAAFTGLNANTTYFFRVRAVNNNGIATAWSELGSTSTLALPPASLNFSAPPPTASAIQLNWSGGTNGPGTPYTVGISTSPDFNPPAVTTQTVYATDVSTAGLVPNTTYYFQAFATGNAAAPTAYAFDSTSTLAAIPLTAVSTFSAVTADGFSVSWGADGNPVNVTTYTVEVSTDPNFESGMSPPYDVSFATVPAAPMAAFSGLNADTTYFFRIQSVNNNGVATAWADLGSTTTLAAAPAGFAWGAVHASSVVVSWAAESAQGYEVEASSTNFGAIPPGGGIVYFSSTTNGAATSLAVVGLDANTTYYFTAGAYNWSEALDSVPAGSTSTLSVAVSGIEIYAVYSTSATLNWLPLPAVPQNASAEGYELDAATADASGVADFGGTIFSSITFNGVQPATLTVQGLDPGTTYQFRVGSLNWNQLPDFVLVGSSMTLITPETWTGGGGDSNWYTPANWSPNGIPGSGSPVTIDMNAAVTVSASSPAISFSSLTLGDAAGSFAATLTISTSIKHGGSIAIYSGSGLTQDSTQQLAINGDLTMMPGSSLAQTAVTANPQNSEINLLVSGTFDLMPGATIAVAGLGFAGGADQAAGTGPGGGGTSSSRNTGGGGGGHGGGGGPGTGTTGGSANDSATDPVLAGSGGGGGGKGGAAASGGGNGGGCVIIQSSSMTIDGLIDADGAGAQNVSDPGGGGAGGAVNLTADDFNGSGSASASGGPGGTSTAGNGGGGGGGRIAVNIVGAGSACDILYNVNGGTSSATAGGNGTISSTSTFQLQGFSGVAASSSSITWQWLPVQGNPQNIEVFDTVSGANSGPLPATQTSWMESGLLANTTYTAYLEATGCGNQTDSSQASFATLTSTPTAAAPALPAASVSSIQAEWSSYPATPLDASGEGYELDASSTDFSGGAVYSSVTYSRSQSSLIIGGLEANTTYFMRLEGLNWAGSTGPYTALGSTPTLALAPTALTTTFLDVYFASATVAWTALPTSPSTSSCEGYELDASTASDFSGTIYSSITYAVADSTLSIANLDLSTTWYFRVGSLNWAGVPDDTSLGPLTMELSVSSIVINLGAINPGVALSTVSVSSVVVTNLGNIPATIALWASTATAGSPWSLSVSSGIERPVLQALWNSAAPPPSAFNAAVTGSTTTSGGAGGAYAGNQTAFEVPAGASRTIWVQFWLPTSTVAAGIQQVIQLFLSPVYP